MLNLLPPSEKKFLAQEHKRRLFIILGTELFVFLIALLSVLVALEFYILGENTTQKYLSEQFQYENQSPDFVDFKNIILKYNKELSLADAFYKDRKFIHSALKALLDVERPDGLYFTSLYLQSQKQSNKTAINVSGVSDTRDNLLIFKKNLEAEEKLQNINFSPESWISQKNVNFNLTLELINGS